MTDPLMHCLRLDGDVVTGLAAAAATAVAVATMVVRQVDTKWALSLRFPSSTPFRMQKLSVNEMLWVLLF